MRITHGADRLSSCAWSEACMLVGEALGNAIIGLKKGEELKPRIIVDCADLRIGLFEERPGSSGASSPRKNRVIRRASANGAMQALDESWNRLR